MTISPFLSQEGEGTAVKKEELKKSTTFHEGIIGAEFLRPYVVLSPTKNIDWTSSFSQPPSV